MNVFAHGWSHQVIKLRWFIIAITLALAALAPLSFNRLYHDDSNESYFLDDDPNLIAFNGMVDKFGDPEYLLVGISARDQDRDVFTAETINMIAELTAYLENHRHITQVRSLSKYQYTHNKDGLLATDDLFEDLTSLAHQPQQLDRARDIIAGEHLALETLISRDLKHTQIAARSIYLPGENQHKVDLVHELRAFIAERGFQNQGYNLHLSGMPVIGERFQVLTQRDMAWIVPTMTAIMMVILFVIFRSVFATLVPLVVIGSTMMFITAIQGVFKWPFTAVNSALIPTTIILAVGTTIHVLVEFFQFRRDGKDPVAAATATVDDLFYAILFTCLTTSFGFIALTISDLGPVREFAVLAAMMPMIIFILSVTILPAVLSFIPWLPHSTDSNENFILKDAPHNKTTFTTKIVTHTPNLVQKHKTKLAYIGIILTLLSIYGATHISVDSNILNYFKKDSWVSRDLVWFNENFKGISNLEIIIDSGEAGGIKNPDLLARIDALQNWIAQYQETGKPTSLLDFYKQINQALHQDSTDHFQLPSSREMAAQFLLLYENTGADEDLTDLKDFNEQFLRMRVPVLNMNASQLNAFHQQILNIIDTRFSDLNIDITGTLILQNAQNNYVNRGMLRSFGIAILVIGCSFIILFRSLKYGFIALVPSIVPILLTGSIVSLAGISMDLGTMIVGAMTIGIAVDDSIHLMSRYLLLRRRGFDVDQSIRVALLSSGKAVILTSVILVTGFSVMLLGSFVSYIYVGLFSAMIMSFALLGDLLFMPAFLYLLDHNKHFTTEKPCRIDNASIKESTAHSYLKDTENA